MGFRIQMWYNYHKWWVLYTLVFGNQENTKKDEKWVVIRGFNSNENDVNVVSMARTTAQKNEDEKGVIMVVAVCTHVRWWWCYGRNLERESEVVSAVKEKEKGLYY